MKQLIVAHRGSSGAAPENTLAAFQRAVDDGADMIELDVRMTKDFELVVLHDRTVRRTTNGRGNIWDLTLADLRTLDAGSWFDKRFSSERIPTLRQVLDLLPSHIHLNIEVKTDGERRRRIAFEESIVLLIRERNLLKRVLVSSFDHKFLSRLRKLDSDISLGALHSPVRDIVKRPSAVVRKIGAQAFTCSVAQLSKRLADDVHSNGIRFGCYTVNTKRQLQKATKFGVELIITNYPREMKRFMQ